MVTVTCDDFDLGAASIGVSPLKAKASATSIGEMKKIEK